MLMQEFPGSWVFVEYTLRAPDQGRSTAFIITSAKNLESNNGCKGQFAEHAEVHGNHYGTTHAAIKAVTDQGKVCVLDIDVQGVKQVSATWKTEPRPLFTFIQPTSMEALEDRLRTAPKTRLKLQNECWRTVEMEFKLSEEGQATFDATVVNDDLDTRTKNLKHSQLKSHLSLCLCLVALAAARAQLHPVEGRIWICAFVSWGSIAR